MRRIPSLLAVVLAALLVLAGCGGGNNLKGGSSGGGGSGGGGSSSSSGGSSGSKGSLTIGSASFSEQVILADMYAQLLNKAGYTTNVKTVTSRELYEPALESGAVDVVPEYAATMADFLNKKEKGANAPSIASGDLSKTVQALTRVAQKRGLKVLKPTQAVDTNAYAVSKSFATKHHLKTLSDLGKSGIPVTIAAGEECKDRPFCEPGLKKTYGIKITKIDPLGVDTVQGKRAVQQGRDQLALVLSTDATLPDFNLVVLADDKHLQNADNVVPVVNAKSAGSPAVANALNKLAPVLTTDDLRGLDRKVDAQRMKPEDVAKSYLQQKGLL